MDNEYIGKHLKYDVHGIKNALPGECFHGEVWMRCPYCRKATEMVGSTPIKVQDGYRIYKCECGELFKDC